MYSLSATESLSRLPCSDSDCADAAAAAADEVIPRLRPPPRRRPGRATNSRQTWLQVKKETEHVFDL